ncbi:hypothetical protein GCM10028833_32140 [Glycomyces tarimensis]
MRLSSAIAVIAIVATGALSLIWPPMLLVSLGLFLAAIVGVAVALVVVRMRIAVVRRKRQRLHQDAA